MERDIILHCIRSNFYTLFSAGSLAIYCLFLNILLSVHHLNGTFFLTQFVWLFDIPQEKNTLLKLKLLCIGVDKDIFNARLNLFVTHQQLNLTLPHVFAAS